MSDHTIGLLAVLIMTLMILARIPIAVSMLITGVVGNSYFLGVDATLVQFQLLSWEIATNFILISLPLFIWMGQLGYSSGVGSDLYRCFYKWFGHRPGGLAVSSTVSTATFGAVTGSSVATVMTMGKMLMPEMRRYNYSPSLASGSLASAGVLAILIPPSVPLVFYGVWTESSIGDLFIAGVIPGIMLTVMFSAYIWIYCFFKPSAGPAGQKFSFAEKFNSLLGLLPFLCVMFLVLGSIYGGIATTSEAAAVGVAGMLMVALAKKRLNKEVLRESIGESSKLSSNIFILLLGGGLFSRFLVQTDLTASLIQSVTAMHLPLSVVLLLLVFMYLVLGAIIDTFGMIILTLPFVFPLVTSMGVDPIWFGIFIVMMIELALITPPIGLNVIVMKQVVPDVALMDIYRGTFPFVILCLLMVGLLIMFPEIALWLPDKIR
ncbi:MAG: C4-dicarboxylate transporter DctM subunit [Pseudohongiellaceae bacterium]|jgi:C4-dicarboxylate transporter DctM subunit